MKFIDILTDRDLDAAIRDITHPPRESADAQRQTEALEATRAIVEDVRQRGAEAVAEYTERFDGVRLAPDAFEVTSKEVDEAMEQVSPELISALERAHENIEAFHRKSIAQSWEERDADGTVMGQRVTPIESAGVYVPGGKAFYPSSVLMNIVPARAAGVRDIVMASPPSWEGTIHPLVLAAARIAGATRIFRVGGAQSVAALAYGAGPIPPVVKITGPGNIYVSLAKRLVSDVCAIDKEAGPSEVLVIADGSAEPRLAAAEMLAQAEHEEDAVPMLIATSREYAEKVMIAVESELLHLSRAVIALRALENQGRAYIVRSLDEAVTLANALAPEHMALQTAEPEALFARIQNVGCTVLGAGTPVALGDYFAGPNHILPTGRRARFASPLTAADFCKVTNYFAYAPERLEHAANDVINLATAEELTAHARSVEVRR